MADAAVQIATGLAPGAGPGLGPGPGPSSSPSPSPQTEELPDGVGGVPPGFTEDATVLPADDPLGGELHTAADMPAGVPADPSGTDAHAHAMTPRQDFDLPQWYGALVVTAPTRTGMPASSTKYTW